MVEIGPDEYSIVPSSDWALAGRLTAYRPINVASTITITRRTALIVRFARDCQRAERAITERVSRMTVCVDMREMIALRLSVVKQLAGDLQVSEEVEGLT